LIGFSEPINRRINEHLVGVRTVKTVQQGLTSLRVAVALQRRDSSSIFSG